MPVGSTALVRFLVRVCYVCAPQLFEQQVSFKVSQNKSELNNSKKNIALFKLEL